MAEKRRPKPPFGGFASIPLWFVNLCLPVLEHSTVCVYVVIWANSRWHTGRRCEMSIRELARAAGTGKEQVCRAIAVLSASNLIEIAPKSESEKWYFPVLHTPERAKELFGSEWARKVPELYPKRVRNSVPAARTEALEKCTRSEDIYLDEEVDARKVVSMPRRTAS